MSEELFGSEGEFVEVDGFGSVADGEERGEGSGDHEDSFGWVRVVYGLESKRFAPSRECPHLRIEIWGYPVHWCNFIMGHSPFLPILRRLWKWARNSHR